MSLGEVALLSVVQGITEFLPVSSSGHLVLAQTYLGLSEVPVLFNLILHLGTACATVLVYYRIIGVVFRDLGMLIFPAREERKKILERGNVKLAAYIALSTLCTAVLGLLFKDRITSFFHKPLSVSFFLFFTGIMLLLTKYIRNSDKQIGDLSMHAPVIIGGAQAVAMLPGVSRSGITISTGLFLGMERSFAGSYSFLLSIPSILGASLVEVVQSGDMLYSIEGKQSVFLLSLTGFIISFATGYIALQFLLSFLRKGKLYAYAFYCFALAIISGVFTSVYF
jgi:undecaprenyl-diphosphatase